MKSKFCDTMTVGELIRILQKFPEDIQIACTWESTIRSIDAENIYESKFGCILIDSDFNYYKDSYEIKKI
jgi:hypothetical protein